MGPAGLPPQNIWRTMKVAVTVECPGHFKEYSKNNILPLHEYGRCR